jgi:hypothetical protein
MKKEFLGSLLLTSVVAAFSVTGPSSVSASPHLATTTANSCSVCHGPAPGQGRKAAGLISVSGFSKRTDLGTQLDGKVRGSLKTVEAVAGTKTTLSVDLVSLAGISANANYSLQVKRLEKSGQQVSTNNFLGWTNANSADSGWIKHGTKDPYFTKDISGASPGTFTFQLGLNGETPVDVYDVEFAVAGLDSKGLFYLDEHYYVAVVSPTLFTEEAVTWSGALTSAGYVLEVADSPEGPWSVFQGATAVLDGSQVALMKSSAGAKKFFRLHKP